MGVLQMHAVILTKSAMKKNGSQGACTTAYDLDTDSIVRFVSSEDGRPIPYYNANAFNKLDVVDVKVLKPCPSVPQTENLLVDPGSFKNYGHYDPGIRDIFLRWRKRPVFPRFLGTGAYKLGSVDQFRHSLELAAVRDFQIKKNQFDSAKASFCMLNGTRHNYFSVTDLDFHLKNDENVLNIGRAYIVASIPTSPFFHGEVNLGYFIFVASIFPVEDKPQLNL